MYRSNREAHPKVMKNDKMLCNNHLKNRDLTIRKNEK